MDLHDRAYLAEQITEQMERARNRAAPWRSLIALFLALVLVGVSTAAHEHHGDRGQMWDLIWIGTTVAFVLFAGSAVLGLSKRVREVLQVRLGASHASMVRYVLVLFGFGVILTVTLDLFGLSIGRLLLGGALTGVLLGIAAQQSLANLFAGIVLLVSRPFQVGDEIKLYSGALGGPHEGQVVEIGMSYVRLQGTTGVTSLPNAQVLAAAVGPRPADVPEQADPPPAETAVPADPATSPAAALGAAAGADDHRQAGG